MPNIVWQIISFLPCLAYDLLEWLRDLFLVRVLGRHRIVTHDVTREGCNFDGATHIAIVAVRPAGGSDLFTLNLINALAEQGFYILLMSNAPLSEGQRNVLLSRCHRIIERAPVGRDFGCYQAGLRTLGLFNGGLPAACECLVLANDSMFYRSDLSDIISEMMQFDNPWVAMFENFEQAYHAQSFFLMFYPQIFRSPVFGRFWRKYKPYSSRKHTIRKGEVGLTRTLRKARFVPSVCFSSTRIRQVIEAAQADPLEICNLLPYCSDMSWREWAEELLEMAKHGLSIEERSPTLLFAWQNFLRTIAHVSESANPTHVVGLILNCMAKAPLKRDVCYRNIFTINQVLGYATGFDARELGAMEVDLRSKGLFVSLSFPKKLLCVRGRI
ncbi:MAG TPA: rhamnan synthesis F family protein [Acetobacteraceae bacterium]|nr:rhamnan synthesis F family protein [Acetobacteraceae bacterium]